MKNNIVQYLMVALVVVGAYMVGVYKTKVEYLEGIMGRRPIIVAPYDAELFGHWWFEGPDWLNFLIRKIRYDQKNIKLIINL